jgi:vacuolar protein sorting-associated protein 51
MSQSTSITSSPSPSVASSKLTASLNAARRGEPSTSSTPIRRGQGNLTPTARKQALRDFYNLDKSKNSSSTSELDKADFDGKDYVDKLVRERNLSALILMENELVQGLSPTALCLTEDIRNLDGERKSLVYDNYNKLIAATETIRKVSLMGGHRITVDENAS